MTNAYQPAPVEKFDVCPYTGVKLTRTVRRDGWELFCFKTRRETGLRRVDHIRQFHALTWPWFKWNPWNEWAIDRMCEHNLVAMTGCASSGKSTSAIAFAIPWWLSAPDHSRVVLTSTSAKAIRSRQWAEVQKFWTPLAEQYSAMGFNMVNSEMRLESTKGDARHAIIAVAVEEGELSKSMAKIQGIHTKRMLVIVDEATDTPEAIFRVCSNLSKGCDEFMLVVIGNANSQLDPHGQYCKPVNGWGSITVEDEEWATEKGGVCLHFDGEKSPNMPYAVRMFDGVITRDDVLKSRRDEGETTPEHWKFTRGFWPPEGILRTVLSPLLAEKYGVAGTLTFLTGARPCAALDPAFEGGDRRVLKLGRMGAIAPGKLGVQFQKTVLVQIDVRSMEPIHFQIAREVIRVLEEEKVAPQDFAMDTTGEGGGLADIIATLWSNRFLRVEFGGKASELPVSVHDHARSCDRYKNRVTELWFSVREYARNGQIGGMDADAIHEFCQRKYVDEKNVKCVESKDDMKQRTRKSPDHGDAVAVMIALARTNGEAAGGTNWNQEPDRQWLDQAIKMNSVYEEAA